MTATKQDITIEQGADFDEPFVLTDDSGAPDDLTGCSFVLQIRTDYEDPTALITLSTADDSLVVDIGSGTVRPAVGSDVTAAFFAGTYVYDLKERKADGSIRRRRQGIVTVSPEATTDAPPMPPPPPGAYGQFDFSNAGNSGLIAGVF